MNVCPPPPARLLDSPPPGDRASYYPPCANVVIASPGPDKPTTFRTRFGDMRSRAGALLQNTEDDARGVYQFWGKTQPDVPNDLHILLIDPSLDEVESAIRYVSSRLSGGFCDDVGLNLFFAGHGEPCTGNLIFHDGMLSPTRLLDLQAEDVRCGSRGERTIGVWLDSCYSGAFLVRLALAALEHSEDFRLREGLASCLPDEESFEWDDIGHGVFTYTQLFRGNAHVDMKRFNRAILQNDARNIAVGLQGLVASMGSATAFLTDGEQVPLSLLKDVVTIDGDFADVCIDEESDFDTVQEQLLRFKRNGWR